ncbi:hypothetical protein FB45DRAFT_904108 [Roridomyces roridus]|uniref:Uncharacterized protein n=1 Tax=Roridomyces roridus TaxID=1738132 RepID=A0AAD7C4U3_9AGAR|nr:hypothetical protein FB45DRAFT_904108 [Roridomyces roridus]
MASSPERLTSSPFAGSSRQFSNEPATPLRGSNASRMAGELSPASTLSETSFNFRASTFTPIATRKTLIRADPAILTAFDPADRELYNLWSPKI